MLLLPLLLPRILIALLALLALATFSFLAAFRWHVNLWSPGADSLGSSILRVGLGLHQGQLHSSEGGRNKSAEFRS